jgi:hypothetical protein
MRFEMASYNEQIQRLWERYEAETGQSAIDPDAFLQWAIDNRLWLPRPKDVRRQMRSDLSDALRQAMRTDDGGITYRAKQYIRSSEDGEQMELWFDTDKATRTLMHKAVQQRRQGIVQVAHRTKCDVDHYNTTHPTETPIPLELDFTDDVAEIETAERMEREKKAA